jgi:hypothetical protein
MIEEMSSSIKGYLSRIQQRLETMEVSTKPTIMPMYSAGDTAHVLGEKLGYLLQVDIQN